MIKEQVRRVELGDNMVIEVPVRPVPVVEKPQAPTREQALSRLKEMVPVLRKAARLGAFIRKWQAQLQSLHIKGWQPFVAALAEPYSDTQSKFRHNGVEVTLTQTQTESIEPEDLINAVGIEKALVLNLLTVDMKGVEAVSKTKMLDIEILEPFVNKVPHTSISIRLVPKTR